MKVNQSTKKYFFKELHWQTQKNSETFVVSKVSIRIFAPQILMVKEQILKTAAEMFINLGFKSVTMDDIAQNLGISKKTIYNHFSTKTKLVEATTFYVLDEITAGIEKIREKNYNAVVELFEIKHFTMSHLKDERSSPQFQLEKYYPQIFRIVKKHHLEQMESHVSKNIEQGILDGLYRKDIEVDFISKLYFIGIMGTKDPDFFPPQKFSIQDLYEKFLEYHLRAIVTEEGLKVLQQYLITNRNE